MHLDLHRETMGIRENWTLFVESAKAKADSHDKVAVFWDNTNNKLNLLLIVLSAITTVLAALKGIPDLVVVAISGMGAFQFFMSICAEKTKSTKGEKLP